MRSAPMRSHRPSAARSMNMKRPDRLHSLESVRSRCIWPAFLHRAAAGGMRLRRGGLRSGRGWRGGSGEAVCRWFVVGVAVLVRGGLRSVHACCLPHGDKQDGLRYFAFLFRLVEIAIRAFSRRWRGYLPFVGSLWGCAFICGDLDGLPGTWGTELRRERGWRRGFCALCAATLALQYFPRGVRWRCALQTAPKSLRLSGLSSRCGGAGVVRV